MENIKNKIQDNFYSKFLKIPLIQKLFSVKIGRLLYIFTFVITIILIYVTDTDSVSTLLDVILIVIFFISTLWRLNDMGRPKWWALGILIPIGAFYIDYEIIANMGAVVLVGIIVLLSYLPQGNTKKVEIQEIKNNNNIMIKNKIFNKKTIISFVLGLVVMFGGIYLFNRFKSNCLFSNVGTVEIFGEISLTEDPDYISTSALNVIQQIEALDADSSIKGILLDISSGGGGTESSESIMLAVQRASKPVVAVIRDMGASGAYMIATAADRIYANKMSDVGSIGITNEFLDTSEKDRREGVVFYNFSSGKYKGVFKEHNKITQDQKDEIMEDIMKSHDIFVEYVSANRNIPLAEVKSIATGETFLGDDALKLKLIDEIGGVPEAKSWLREQTGEEVGLCSL